MPESIKMLLHEKSIFIVEDNMYNRLTYHYALIREGAHVVFEKQGIDTLGSLNRVPKVDLIILDLMLPRGVDGFALIAQIRSNPKYADIPIIAVSAADPGQTMARCRALGFDGYISKPINEDMFPALLVKILSGESVWIA